MEVKNVEYFHIHRIGQHTPLWQVGQRINWVQKRNNLFYDYYNNHGLFYDDGSGMIPIHAAIERFLSGGPEYQNQQVGHIVKISQQAIKQQALFIREEVFEEVRENYFPHLPSRKTCIWVCSKEAVKFWWDTLNNQQLKILKLRLTGSLYIADQRHLNADTFPHNDYRAKAFEYWTGTDGIGLENQEILFEGIIDVLEEIPSPEQINV